LRAGRAVSFWGFGITLSKQAYETYKGLQKNTGNCQYFFNGERLRISLTDSILDLIPVATAGKRPKCYETLVSYCDLNREK
jgi:hypothetical protein